MRRMRTICFAAVTLGAGCVPGALQCRLDALAALPDDPMQVTVFDTVDMVARLRACQAPAQTPDAGSR